MTLEKPWDIFALAISTDQRWVLYGRFDYTDQDLGMILEMLG